MTIKLIAFTGLVSAVIALASPAAVYADSSYGGTQPNDLTINKQVKNPVTSLFVENLGSTDPTFSPDGTVTFRLTVKNSSGETMNPVTVTDTLPQYLTYVSANIPATYDSGSRVITMKFDNFTAGSTKTIEINAKVSAKSAFPSDKSFFCVTNYSKVTSPQRPNGNDDTADLCMQTAVQGQEKLPVAGFEDFATLIPFGALGAMGLSMIGLGKVTAKKRG